MALHDVPAEQLIAKTAEALKKDIKQPEWATFVKTGHTRERQPTNLDWWYVRAASVLRRVALLGPIGTEKLRTHYGSRKSNGNDPPHHYKAGGSVIRAVLQQLDEAGLTKVAEKLKKQAPATTTSSQRNGQRGELEGGQSGAPGPAGAALEKAIADLKSLRSQLTRPIPMGYRYPPQLREEVSSLASAIGGVMARPTVPQTTRLDELKRETERVVSTLNTFVTKTIPEINAMLAQTPHVVAGTAIK